MYERLIENLRIHSGFCSGYPHYCGSCTESESVCDVSLAGQSADAIEELSKERKTGKWISYIEDGYLECPFCGAATNCDGDESELHFCFSCGAQMEGVENDV